MEATGTISADEDISAEELSAPARLLYQHAQPFRERISGARSNTMLRLFDYLLSNSARGHAAKEIEIFHVVFAHTGRTADVQDSGVRTYIHRLRQKMDEFYASYDGPRLILPKGEYRLSLVEGEDRRTDRPSPAARQLALFGSHRTRLWYVALAAIAGFAGLIWFASAGSTDRVALVANSFAWQPLMGNDRPTAVVVGDYYLIGKSVDGRSVTHLLRDFSINSRDDLDRYLMSHPEDGERYMDVDLSYFPTGAGPSLESIVPIVTALGSSDSSSVRSGASFTTALSRFDPNALGRSNVVYLGLFSGLGILRGPLFKASGFAVGSSYEELVDRKSRKTYVASRSIFDDRNMPQIDYGYVAGVPGPSGNRILIITGTRDVALIAMARLMADPGQIRTMTRQLGDNPNFEALYEVRSIGTTATRLTLATARPVNTRDMWIGDVDNQFFPDSAPPTSRLEMAADH